MTFLKELPSKAPGAGRPSLIDPIVATIRETAGGDWGPVEGVSLNSLASFRKRHKDMEFASRSGAMYARVKPAKVARTRTAVKATASAAKPAAKRTSRSSG